MSNANRGPGPFMMAPSPNVERDIPHVNRPPTRERPATYGPNVAVFGPARPRLTRGDAVPAGEGVPTCAAPPWSAARTGAAKQLIVAAGRHAGSEPVQPILTADETRVIGALIEKSLVTPEQYPLTLNALTNACNQKSGRNPVTAFTKGEVQRMARLLSDRNLVRINENFKSGTEKYTQTFCNTRYNELKFDDAQLALVCVLLLRGPQTPGEFRTNTRRLHDFADNNAVVKCLESLIEHRPGPLVVQLPRTPGRRDSEYTHLFCGEVDTAAYEASAAAAAASAPASSGRSPALEARIEKLEQEVAELRALLQDERSS